MRRFVQSALTTARIASLIAEPAMKWSKRTKRVCHGGIIFACIVATPLLPDDVVPRFLYKAVLGGVIGGLLVTIIERIFKGR